MSDSEPPTVAQQDRAIAELARRYDAYQDAIYRQDGGAAGEARAGFWCAFRQALPALRALAAAPAPVGEPVASLSAGQRTAVYNLLAEMQETGVLDCEDDDIDLWLDRIDEAVGLAAPPVVSAPAGKNAITLEALDDADDAAVIEGEIALRKCGEDAHADRLAFLHHRLKRAEVTSPSLLVAAPQDAREQEEDVLWLEAEAGYHVAAGRAQMANGKPDAAARSLATAARYRRAAAALRAQPDPRVEVLRKALKRIIGMCDVPPRCACGRPNGLPAVVARASAALSGTGTPQGTEPQEVRG